MGADDTDDLKKALDDTSAQTRNLLITFLLLLFYVFVHVAGTDHRILLIPDSKFDVPLLNIGLPVFYFYVAAPLLILIFHFDLLFNLHKHAEKLRAWEKRAGDGLSLYPFLFNFLGIRSERGLIRLMLTFIAWALLVALPLSMLVFVQVRFLPYHSFRMDLWHQAAVLLDALLILVFWAKIRKEDGKFLTLDLTDINSLHPARLKETLKPLREELARLWAGSRFPSAWKKPAHPLRFVSMATRTYRFETVQILSVCLACYMSLVPYLTPYRAEDTFSLFGGLVRFQRNLHLDGETLLGKQPGDAIIAQFEARHETAEDAYMKYGEGVNLADRDLRFASFSGAKLTKAVLSGAHLQGAGLSRADLQGADLNSAHLQGAVLHEVQLQRADLSFAYLQGADLSFAYLQGAFLHNAQLQGAVYFSAQLQGAELSGAHLQGTDLTWAQLQGAFLSDAELQGADLYGAQLQGADLRYTQLRGAELEIAHLEKSITDGMNFITEPDWEELEKIAELIGEDVPKKRFIERIKAAKKMSAKEPVGRALASDLPGFIRFRLDLACQDKYETKRLYQNFPIRGLPPGYEKVKNKIATQCPEMAGLPPQKPAATAAKPPQQ